MHHRVHEQFAYSDTRVGFDAPLTKRALLDRELLQLCVDKRIKLAQHREQVAINLAVIRHGCRQRVTIHAQKLDVGAGQPLADIQSEQEDAGIRRATGTDVEETEGGQLFLQRPVVLSDDFRRDGLLAVVDEEKSLDNSPRRCCLDRAVRRRSARARHDAR